MTVGKCILHSRPEASIDSEVRRSRSQSYQVCCWLGSGVWYNCTIFYNFLV